MDASAYWKYQMITAGAMGLLLGLGFQQDNRILIVTGFAIGAASLVYLRRQVDEPLYDERSAVVSTKASAAAFSAFTLLSLAAAAVLFYLGSTSNPEYLQWSYGMAFIVCALMLTRLFFWILYTRKLGG